MLSGAVAPVLAALTVSLDIPVRLVDDLPDHVAREVSAAVGSDIGAPAELSMGAEHYRAIRFHRRRGSVIVAGPYQRPGETLANLPVLDPVAEQRVGEALQLASEGLGAATADYYQHLELSNQLEVVGRAVLAITSELELTVVLHRIVDLARELSGSRYAALGIPGPDSELASFITSGMTQEEELRIGDRPRGYGLLGLLRTDPRTIRLRDLKDHPASIGFPPHHPPMGSFLGVPIISRGHIVGHLYLTEKRLAPEFTDEDVRLVELLARHAGVAMDNARLFEQLEEQRRYLQAIIDQLPEAVLLAEANPDRIVLANPQASQLLGWEIRPPLPIDEFAQRNERMTGDGEAVEVGGIPLLRALWTGEESHLVELKISRPDGSRITTLVNSAPLRDNAGAVRGAIIVFQDITQIKDAEQLKDDFLSLVSHELRTPLTTIQGNALMLHRDGDRVDQDLQREMLTDISSESRRLAILIENMVQLANIRAGRLHMETEPVLVRSLVQNAVDGVRQLAPDREFAVALEPGLIAIGDPGRLDQVLRNLLHNAVKYSPATEQIEVGGQSLDSMIELSIRDYGPGIQPEDFPFVFERFQRSAQDVARGTPGMGLGLYLARHLIEAHGGQIVIETPETGGTLIRLTVPRLVE
jgi:signal transduction histidine kinase